MTYYCGLAECPCTKKKCIRFGLCDECIDYHKQKGKLPYCKRKKFLKTIDNAKETLLL